MRGSEDIHIARKIKNLETIEEEEASTTRFMWECAEEDCQCVGGNRRQVVLGFC